MKSDDDNSAGNVWLVTGAGGNLGSHVVRHLLATRRQRESSSAAAALAPHGDQMKKVVAVVSKNNQNPSMPFIDETLDNHACEVVAGDFTDAEWFARIAKQHEVSVVVHCGAITSVQQCYDDPERATRVNSVATATMARHASEHGITFVYVSTDMVFSGVLPRVGASPSCESRHFKCDDKPAPLSHYGRTKLEGEEVVLQQRLVVVRVPLMYGVAHGTKWASGTFASQLKTLQLATCAADTRDNHKTLRGFVDEFRTPVSYQAAAQSIVAIAHAFASGLASITSPAAPRVFHVAGPERLSRFDMLIHLRRAMIDQETKDETMEEDEREARRHRVEATEIVPCKQEDFKAPEARPSDLSLDATETVGFIKACFPLASSLLMSQGYAASLPAVLSETRSLMEENK